MADTYCSLEVSGQLSALGHHLEVNQQVRSPVAYRERRSVPWLMAVLDLLVAQCALATGFAARHLASPWLTATIGPESYRGIVVGLLALPIAHWFLGLYPGYGLSPVERLRRRIICTVTTFGGLMVFDNLVFQGGWSRAIELSSFVVVLVLSPIAEAAFVACLVNRGWWGTPTVVLGSEEAGRRLITSLLRKRDLGFVPIALLMDSPESWGKTVSGVPVSGGVSLAATLGAHARTVVITMPSFNRTRMAALLGKLPFPRVVFIPDIPGVQSLWTTTRDLGGTLGIEFHRNLLLRRNYYLKRLLDYLLGLPLLLVSLPLIAVLSLWIRRVSPGSPFYSQEREGYRGQKVRVWKLRTMHPNSDQLLERYLAGHPQEREDWQRFFKLKHDPRIIPGVGVLLRRTSLDELPQLWNVLKGEMSLVGPRPFPYYHLEGFGPEFRELRHSVLPGLTGFWQVSERSNADLTMQEHLDTYYIRNWSLWLDAYILARTVKTVLMRTGAY